MTIEYLTESRLLEFCQKNLRHSGTIIHNSIVANSGIKNRPDIQIPDLKMIVEFDGYRHFNDMVTILNDTKKDSRYKEMGYKIVRIPYFVQLDLTTIDFYFNSKNFTGSASDYSNSYPHGFHDPKCLLPADFNYSGITIFQRILQKLPDKVSRAIIDSIEEKVELLGIERVLPEPLFYLV